MTVITPRRGSLLRRRVRRASGAAALSLITLSVAACGVTVPTDPDGTLESVTGATMHVGVTPDPGLVVVTGDEPSGPLVDLVEGFAASIDTRIEWSAGAEETLVGDLESGRIDLAIGGFTDQTPWADRAGITRGYKNIEGSDGRTLVFLVPLGENAFLSKLEAFLDQEVGS